MRISTKNSIIPSMPETDQTRSSFYNVLIIFTLLISLYSQAGIAVEQGMDVALVLDTSGSMKQNDPNQLRVQAAKLFVSLLSRKDKVSLVGFSNRAYPVTPMLSLNSKKNESRLLKAIDKMAANGQYSNLHDAILQGYELLSKNQSPGRSRHIILMSDGKMDLGSESRNLRLLEQTLDYLTPSLASQNIKLHTIAFNEDSYIPLLKLAAEDTGGEFILLKNTDGIHQVFENIFERTKLPQMLPVDSDSFIIDKSVKEVSIVASKFKPDSVISIESPDGDELTMEEHGNNVKWYQARKFDLITVSNPAPGYWLVKYSEGGNKAYIISDIQLEASTTKKKAEPGAPLHIEAYLQKKNRRITNKAILNSTKFFVKAISPTGATIENELVDDGSEIGSERKDGIFGISYAFDKQGTYKIEISAKGETFDRKKVLFINVESATFKTPFKVQQEVINRTDILDSASSNSSNNTPHQATASDSMMESQQHQSNEKRDNASTTSHDANMSEHGAVPEDTAHSSLHGGGDDHSPQEADHASADEHTVSSHEKATTSHGDNGDGEELKANSEFSVKDAVIAFIAFNTFLISLGGGYYLWYRRKQKQKDKDLNKEDETSSNTSIENDGDSLPEVDESASNMELESDEGFSTSISDIDLEEELSSILENEK